MLCPRFWKWQYKCWPKCPPAASVSALECKPWYTLVEWLCAEYTRKSSLLKLLLELLLFPLTQSD